MVALANQASYAAVLEGDDGDLQLIKLEQFRTVPSIVKWIEAEAGKDVALGVTGRTSGLREALTRLGRPWIPVDCATARPTSQLSNPARIPRGARQRKALLCACTVADLWRGRLDTDPIAEFQNWMEQARSAGIDEPNAMALATTGPDGQPSARMVLLKEVSQSGFVFFTNYGSQKGRELDRNPRAALVFYWPQMHRQVRVTGRVSKTTRSQSEAYFETRPRGAQLAAWASWQSSPIPDREALEARVRKMEARFADKAVPAPPNWGGYRLRPEAIEFWQGRPNRLHDRLRYSRGPNGTWKIERLAP